MLEPETEAERALLLRRDDAGLVDATAFPEAERRVRGAFVREVMLAWSAAPEPLPRVVRLAGAVILGELALQDLGTPERFAPALELRECAGPGGEGFDLSLERSSLLAVTLLTCRLRRVEASDARIKFGVSLTRSLFARDSIVRFQGARVEGRFNANHIGSLAPNIRFPELDLSDIRIGRGLSLQGAKLSGVILMDAELGAELLLVETVIMGDLSSYSINADRVSIGAGVFIRGSAFTGECRLVGARVAGQLSITALKQREGSRRTELSSLGKALSADQASIQQGVFICEATFFGMIRFAGASINGQLSIENDIIINTDRMSCLEFLGLADRKDELLTSARDRSDDMVAIALNGVDVRGDLRVMGFISSAQIEMTDAKLGGTATIRHGLINADGRAAYGVVASGVAIGGDCQLGISLEDEAAQESQAYVTKLQEERGTALTCHGRISLDRARIGGSLVLNGLEAMPAPPRDSGAWNEEQDVILSLDHARIGTRLEVVWLAQNTQGTIDLRGAYTPLLQDDGGRGWGEPCRSDQPPCDAARRRTSGVLLRLEGFVYERLADFDRAGEASLRDARFAFLMRQFPGPRPHHTDYAPQPFEQLVRVLRSMGHPEEADWFARQKRIFRTRCRVDRWFAWGMQGFLNIGFGHFYSPVRAIGTLMAALVVGALLLVAANAEGALTRKRNEVMLPAGVIARLAAADPAARIASPSREPCWGPDSFATTSLLGMELGSWAFGRYVLVTTEATVIAFDFLLPLVDLKQDQRCELAGEQGGARLWATVLALYTGFGLILIPLFIATVSGLARRD